MRKRDIAGLDRNVKMHYTKRVALYKIKKFHRNHFCGVLGFKITAKMVPMSKILFRKDQNEKSKETKVRKWKELQK